MVAAVVVAFLALGPFASPDVEVVVEDGPPVDHRNDLPVIRPQGADAVTAVLAARPASRGLLAVLTLNAVLVMGMLVAGAARQPLFAPGPPPPGPPPTRRGPPALLA